MGMIKVLPEAVANRIAAGEVIERPASIAKELIENALDAEATSIEVAIRHGGKSLIRIADNGYGMSREDAETAFLRHATSKINMAEDIDTVTSFGFRGEALPSIAAVSRLKLMTRKKGESVGTEIIIEGGRTVSIGDCSCREGTVIEVRDLFFNTPARRKFMRTDSTENGHVQDMVANLALARLDVQFLLKSADKTVFELHARESVQKRAEAILGEKTAKQMMFVERESQGVRVSGLIGKPLVARSNRMGQTLYVNGRCVKATNFSYALLEGYRGFLMHGQFPVSVLFLDVDASRVDVNVHPTKQEVRISNEAQIKSLIKKMVADRLLEEQDLAPQVRVPAQDELKSFETASYGSKPTPSFLKAASLGTAELQAESIPVQNTEPLTETIAVKDNLKVTKILGQIHHTFIVAETEEGMILIDQHAAHEKVQYEQLLKGFREGKPVSQKLLMDEILEVAPKLARLLTEQLDFLNKLGFEIEEFGKNTFVIRAVPTIFEKMSPVGVVQKYLDEKEEGREGTSLENQESEIAAMLACKTKSVRAHDPLTPEAMRSLVEQLSHCEQPFSCPHGRPSILKHSFEDLEKQFKRKL